MNVPTTVPLEFKSCLHGCAKLKKHLDAHNGLSRNPSGGSASAAPFQGTQVPASQQGTQVASSTSHEHQAQ